MPIRSPNMESWTTISASRRTRGWPPRPLKWPPADEEYNFIGSGMCRQLALAPQQQQRTCFPTRKSGRNRGRSSTEEDP